MELADITSSEMKFFVVEALILGGRKYRQGMRNSTQVLTAWVFVEGFVLYPGDPPVVTLTNTGEHMTMTLR